MSHEALYKQRLHAMQSGVAAEMALDQRATSPKHLRVGVNSAMCDHAGLVRLLIEKGIITLDEYHAAIAEEMKREVERYEKALSESTGSKVTLM